MNTAVHVEQTGFFFKGRFFCSVLGHTPCWCASFLPQTAKKTPHARESNREAKLRSTIWSRGETPLPEQLCRARTSACPQDDAQCNKPRDRVGDSHAKQESPISPINNMWMSENTVLFPWTPVETICYDLRVTQQHGTVQTCSPLVREFSTPQQIASNLQQSHSARLGEGAQKPAHHGPLLLCPPAASYSIHAPWAVLQHVIHLKVLFWHMEMVGGSLQLTDMLHLAHEAMKSRMAEGCAASRKLSWNASSLGSQHSSTFTTEVASLSHHTSPYLSIP